MVNFTPIWEISDETSPLAWRTIYEHLGFKAIPLQGKKPLDPTSWLKTPVLEQWKLAGQQFDGNIGIVLGNGLAVVDTDNQETARIVSKHLDNLGIASGSVSTPRGRHFYLRISGYPGWFYSRKLPSNIGLGELRVQNSYVVAPRSQINNTFYRWNNCTPGMVFDQPVIQWSDLHWLIQDHVEPETIETMPVRLLHRPMSRMVKALLTELAKAKKGQQVGKYPTRSEGEAAVISQLILSGWGIESIQTEFDMWLPGKYKEMKGGARQAYFDKTYYRVLTKIVSNPVRNQIASYWQDADSDPYWKGRNGLVKRDVYLGLLATCWQFASWRVNASQRDLACYCAVSQPVVSKTLKELTELGVVKRIIGGQSWLEAHKLLITPLNSLSSKTMISDNSLRSESCEGLQELWANNCLGRTAGTVYRLLGSDSVSVNMLVRRTGKAWGTIKNALVQLNSVGLAQKRGTGWVLGDEKVASVAHQYETSKISQRRREKYARERERHTEHVTNIRQAKKG
jgi:hypothetical protein